MAELLGGPYPVSVFDPHSSALETFLDFKTFMPADLPIDGMADVAGVIAPDAGAVGRAEQFRAKFSPDAYLISCLKHRDSRTGYISEYEMPDLPARGKYIVVDDICDGGATFNLLAEAWNNDDYAQESELQLFVSHGIFSKGLEAISDTYSRIITTDSWYRLTPNWQNYRFTVYPLLPALFAKIGGNHNV
jgi:phosphoribosylpyrophosphate synthetase